MGKLEERMVLTEEGLRRITSGAEFYQIYNAIMQISLSGGKTDESLEGDIMEGILRGVRGCTPQSGNSPALLTLDYWCEKNVLGRTSNVLRSFENVPYIIDIADHVSFQLLAGVLLAGGRLSEIEYCGLGLAVNGKVTSGINE